MSCAHCKVTVNRQNVELVYITNMHQVAGKWQEKQRLFVSYFNT